MLENKASLNKYQRIDMQASHFSKHNTNKKNFKKSTWKFKNILLNNSSKKNHYENIRNI